MNIKVLKNQVLVKLLPFSAFRKNKLISIPDTAERDFPYMYGVVEAVGPGYRTKKGGIHGVDVKPGDFIIFGRFNGYRTMVDHKIEYRFINAYEVFAVLEE